MPIDEVDYGGVERQSDKTANTYKVESVAGDGWKRIRCENCAVINPPEPLWGLGVSRGFPPRLTLREGLIPLSPLSPLLAFSRVRKGKETPLNP